MKIKSFLSDEALLKISFSGIPIPHIAKKARMGDGVLRAWMRGYRCPKRKDVRLERLAEVLKVPLKDILRR